jgi:hypothetical protein
MSFTNATKYRQPTMAIVDCGMARGGRGSMR